MVNGRPVVMPITHAPETGARNFATGVKNRRQKPTPVFWRRFLERVSWALASSVHGMEHWCGQPGVWPGIRRCWGGRSRIIGQPGVWYVWDGRRGHLTWFHKIRFMFMLVPSLFAPGPRYRRWFGRTTSPASKAFNESRARRLRCPRHLMCLVLPVNLYVYVWSASGRLIIVVRVLQHDLGNLQNTTCSSALSTSHCARSISKRAHSVCRKWRMPGIVYCGAGIWSSGRLFPFIVTAKALNWSVELSIATFSRLQRSCVQPLMYTRQAHKITRNAVVRSQQILQNCSM